MTRESETAKSAGKRLWARFLVLLPLVVAASIAWAAVIVFWLGIGSKVGATFVENTMLDFLNSIVTVAIAYGECLLVATILCAWLASRYEPKGNPDYLVILGCGIRTDGTPSPLLAAQWKAIFQTFIVIAAIYVLVEIVLLYA